ncbi:MAG: metal-dependent transcriptional regulator [Anaerolineales bacterium]|nr:metal-dependent transcriptional regulator [Anaerolineales bacterium]
MTNQPRLSESVEMYLKTLAALEGGGAPVPIAHVAARLAVSPVSAGEMMQRLGRDGLVSHLPHKGVVLTPNGRQLAHDVIRRERLWEVLLHDQLGLPWARVHAWACQLEHATAPEVSEALDAFLGYPAACPQGNTIPRDGAAAVALPLLSDLPLGQPARLAAFEDESEEVLVYLHKRGLAPGVTVTVTEVAPRQGPLTLQLEGGAEQVIGTSLAATIRVQPEAKPA